MLLVSKICSAILLAVLRLLAGLLPLKVHRKLEKWSSQGGGQNGSRRRDRVEIFLSMFLCFGAGLLLSTCFVHMIPEVYHVKLMNYTQQSLARCDLWFRFGRLSFRLRRLVIGLYWNYTLSQKSSSA